MSCVWFVVGVLVVFSKYFVVCNCVAKHYVMLAPCERGHYSRIRHIGEELLNRPNHFLSIIISIDCPSDITNDLLNYALANNKSKHLNIINGYPQCVWLYAINDKQKKTFIHFETNFFHHYCLFTFISSIANKFSRNIALTLHEYLVDTGTIPFSELDINNNNNYNNYNNVLGNYYKFETNLVSKYCQDTQNTISMFLPAWNENYNYNYNSSTKGNMKNNFKYFGFEYKNGADKKIDAIICDEFMQASMTLMKYYTFKYNVPVISTWFSVLPMPTQSISVFNPILFNSNFWYYEKEKSFYTEFSYFDKIRNLFVLFFNENILTIYSKNACFEFLKDLKKIENTSLIDKIIFIYNNNYIDIIASHVSIISHFDYPISTQSIFYLPNQVKYFGFLLPSRQTFDKRMNGLKTGSDIIKFINDEKYSSIATILISFGSVFAGIDDLHESMYDAFYSRINIKTNPLNPSFRIIWKISRKDKFFDFIIKNITNDIYINSSMIFISDWIDQFELLSFDNIKLFVGHGGTNGVQEALYNSKPMLLFPQMVEQNSWSMRMEDLGCGLRIVPSLYLYNNNNNNDNKQNNLSKIILTRVDNLLNNKSFKENCIRLNEMMQASGDVTDAVNYIGYLTKFGNKHLLYNNDKLKWFQKTVFDVYFAIVIAFLIVIIIFKNVVSNIYICIKNNCAKQKSKHDHLSFCLGCTECRLYRKLKTKRK